MARGTQSPTSPAKVHVVMSSSGKGPLKADGSPKTQRLRPSACKLGDEHLKSAVASTAAISNSANFSTSAEMGILSEIGNRPLELDPATIIFRTNVSRSAPSAQHCSGKLESHTGRDTGFKFASSLF